MTQSLEQIAETILELKTELKDLRDTYQGVSKSYVAALSTLSDLTIHSAEAAKRAAKSTEQSKIAAMNALLAAKKAAVDPNLMQLVEAAVSASIAAALAAVESAAAAAAAAAASAAVAHQAEASLLKASSEAATASRLAADSAAEAVNLSNQARELVDDAHKRASLRNGT